MSTAHEISVQLAGVKEKLRALFPVDGPKLSSLTDTDGLANVIAGAVGSMSATAIFMGEIAYQLALMNENAEFDRQRRRMMEER